MPDGVVQWLDLGKGRAAIVGGGRTYATTTEELEPSARRVGVHVHFDVRRKGGADQAVAVTVADGTRRTHQRQRTGAGAPEREVGGLPPSPVRTIELEGRAGTVTVAVVTNGHVDDDEVDYGVEQISGVLRHLDEPVLFARLKLTQAADPARVRPAMAQVEVDVNGELVRAHVAGADMNEAAELLHRHLRDQLEQRAQHREDRRTRNAIPPVGEWRHGDRPSVRPDFFDRPVDERELVRHKTFSVDDLTPDEAAFDMNQLDYDFHLYRDLASGEDSVLERVPDGTYRLTRLHPSDEPSPSGIPLTVATAPAPALTVEEAVERLDVDGEKLVFFENAASHRGNVVYRRYDGHYGLITPA